MFVRGGGGDEMRGWGGKLDKKFIVTTGYQF